jgi:hypothetical protein
MGMTGAEKLLRATLPTRRAQLAYHAELERYWTERGHPLRIIRVMGRWELKWIKK